MTKKNTQLQRGKSAEVRFWEKVKRGEGCWMWESAVQGAGYGVFWAGDGRSVNAHRFAWELEHKTQVPPGMVVMHLCNVKGCVNPSHLRIGTHKENSEMASKDGLQPIGERNGGGGKLTEDKVREIIADKENGCWRAAKKYGVSVSLIKNIRRRKIWKHVSLPTT